MSSDREFWKINSIEGISLDARVYRPNGDDELVVILVHPYYVFGGFQGLMKGIARRLADRGLTAVTFDMRGVDKSTGQPSLTGFAEVDESIAKRNKNSKRVAAVSKPIQILPLLLMNGNPMVFGSSRINSFASPNFECDFEYREFEDDYIRGYLDIRWETIFQNLKST